MKMALDKISAIKKSNTKDTKIAENKFAKDVVKEDVVHLTVGRIVIITGILYLGCGHNFCNSLVISIVVIGLLHFLLVKCRGHIFILPPPEFL
jgi:hypothetical protein